MAVQYTPAALATLRRIPAKFQAQITKRADSLELDPFSHQAKKLAGGYVDTYRIRQGAYRILYAVQSGQITIIEISDRKESYTKKGRR
jgi:mRNA-degrading endonuclease RelE of RelBE toxin-antitoxin system